MNDEQKRTLTLTMGVFFIIFSLYLIYMMIPGIRMAFSNTYMQKSYASYSVMILSFSGNLFLGTFGMLLLMQKFSPAFTVGVIGSSLKIAGACIQVFFLVSRYGLILHFSVLTYAVWIISAALLVFLLTYYRKNILGSAGQTNRVGDGSPSNIVMDSDAARGFLVNQYVKKMLTGLAIAVIGFLVTAVTYNLASSSSAGGTYVVTWGAMLYGVYDFFRGLIGWLKFRA